MSGAQTNYQRTFSFGSQLPSGSAPRGPLMQGSDGLLYGTTYQGGLYNLGSVFSVAPDGTGFTVLCSLQNAIYPFGGLVESSAGGFLVGTTSGGGTNNAGTVFRVRRDGSAFQVLHHFSQSLNDGNSPLCTLIDGGDGLLYGATVGGGSNNLGVVFRLAPDGSNFSIVHHFNGTDGSYPATGLLKGVDGILYGVTRTGGNSNQGTVFAVTKDGNSFALLHQFAGKAANDGGVPLGTLAQGADGFLYGTTYAGGGAADLGTVYKVSTNGTVYAVLHAFQGAAGADGLQPVAGLLAGSGNVLYGTVPHGGATDSGFAFRLNTDGSSYTLLHSFGELAGDGSQPYSPLLAGSDGRLYGSTYYGGGYETNGFAGSLFRLSSSGFAPVITGIETKSLGVALSFAGGSAGQVYQIQAADDLATPVWRNLGSTAAAAVDGSFDFLDEDLSFHAARFYRSAGPAGGN